MLLVSLKAYFVIHFSPYSPYCILFPVQGFRSHFLTPFCPHGSCLWLDSFALMPSTQRKANHIASFTLYHRLLMLFLFLLSLWLSLSDTLTESIMPPAPLFCLCFGSHILIAHFFISEINENLYSYKGWLIFAEIREECREMSRNETSRCWRQRYPVANQLNPSITEISLINWGVFFPPSGVTIVCCPKPSRAWLRRKHSRSKPFRLAPSHSGPWLGSDTCGWELTVEKNDAAGEKRKRLEWHVRTCYDCCLDLTGQG